MKNELVKSTVPGLSIHLGGGYGARTQSSVCPLHFHDEIEILAMREGIKHIWVDDKEYILHPGEVTFINSRVPHYTQDDPPSSHMILLQFRLEEFLDLPNNSRPLRHRARFANNAGEHPIQMFGIDEDGGEFYRYILEMYEEYKQQKKSYEIYLRGHIYLILGYLYRRSILTDALQSFDHHAVGKIMPALTYIDDNYAEDISLSTLSALCGLSEGYFCRQFKEATGSTFVEYLNFVRIYNAEKLLTRTEKPILDISMDVGFSTISYFNRTFRRFKSCSPRSYRHAQYLKQ